jgi:CRISPR system Cascade subunit CasA
MAKSPDPVPAFSLWTEPWITLERPDGGTDRLGIEQTLLQAHECISIYDPSPLVVVGIHRLLVAILQAAIDLNKQSDLNKLWKAGQFPDKAVKAFGARHVERFDLFSASAPFLQSADLPLQASKGDKTIAYLATETPAGTEITHYRHGAEDVQAFCPVCAAGCLVTIPPFATTGGRGIKPSINGVPPIYVLPGGKSLFESLAASLLLPGYRPEVASKNSDAAWWTRRPIVERGKEVHEVGYLYSLTFPARRVRLHPEQLHAACSRCGQFSEWGVRTMVFEMGESRPKDAPFWFDPFVAYRLRVGKGRSVPTPIRPVAGQAVWREFAGLFLQKPMATDNTKNRTLRPRVLDQMADMEIGADVPIYPFRCVGLRTDMKAKVFEWIDAGFEVPPALLRDQRGAIVVDEAIQFARECANIIAGVFHDMFGEKSNKQERHRGLKTRMQEEYWAALADPFRQFVLTGASPNGREAARCRWLDTVVREARQTFASAAAGVGDNAVALRQRVQGEHLCDISLAKKRKEYLPNE